MAGLGHGMVSSAFSSKMTGGVRIMTGSALQAVAGYQEARRLAETIGGIDDFETVRVQSCGALIEREKEIGERLAGTVGEPAALVFADGVREGRTGGFEMA